MKHLKKMIWFAVTIVILSIWGGVIIAQDEEATGFEKIAERFTQDKQAAWNLTAVSATPCIGGTAAGYECNNIDLLAFMPLSSIGGGEGNDIWGWTDSQDGKEYALMGRTNGTSFVDISDPENPIYLGNLPSHGASSIWRDIKVYANHAFIVSEASGHGMQVFDLTRLRNVPAPPVTFDEDAHFGGFGSAHNIVINEDSGFAYGVGTGTCSGGLHMVNIQTPTSPTDAGCFSQDGYTHDAQCIMYDGPDVTHVGKEICFNSNEDTLTIADVTNKGATVELSRKPYPGSSYAHQGWVTDDHAYFLMDDELDEQNSGHNTRTRVWDVSDLDNPVLVGYQDGPTAAIDHNLYIHEGYAYQSNYRAGLRITDLENVATAVMPEAAYFDIYPGSNSAAFNGNWSNYPYFESGVVIVSGIEQGLYILEPDLPPDFALNVTAVSTSICSPNSATEPVALTAKNGYTGTVNLSASGVPAGATVTFAPASVTPTDSSTMSITVTGAATGNYPITVLGGDGVISHTDTIDLIVNDGVPAASSLISPANTATGVATSPTFTWTAIPGADNYTIEIATDSEFSNIVDSASGLMTTSYQTAVSLNATTTYYWRVQANNACGDGAYTAVFAFTTADIACTIYSATGLPKPIPSSGTSGSTVSTINIPDAGTIDDVNVVDLVGTHTYMGDLDFQLASPTGSSIQLRGESCGTMENFDINYDDEAAPGPSPCPPTDGGTYQPDGLLSTFDGETLSGEWTLTINDNYNGDSGSLSGWGVEICYAPEVVELDPPTLISPADDTTDVSITPTLTWSAVSGADDYLVELAMDDSFSTIVVSDTVAATSYSGFTLNEGETYSWRVTAQATGDSATSSIFDFTTKVVYRIHLPAVLKP